MLQWGGLSLNLVTAVSAEFRVFEVLRVPVDYSELYLLISLI